MSLQVEDARRLAIAKADRSRTRPEDLSLLSHAADQQSRPLQNSTYYPLPSLGFCAHEGNNIALFSLRIKQDNLELLEDIRDLGIFEIPAAEISGGDKLHRYFTSILVDSEGHDSPIASDRGAILSITDYLLKQPISNRQPADSVSVQLFCLSVDGSVPDMFIPPGSSPAWKWTKHERHPIYPQPTREFWKPELGEVILSGKELVGKDFRLFAQGTSVERLEELRHGMILHPATG